MIVNFRFVPPYSSLDSDISTEKGVIDLIKAEGYPAETHYVETKDGYILQLHRSLFMLLKRCLCIRLQDSNTKANIQES